MTQAAAGAESCAYVVADRQGAIPARFCGTPCRPGSAYCPEHHALCHLRSGSAAERRQLHAIDALADAVGGRHGRPAAYPPPPLLRRLEQVVQQSLRPKRSRYVRKDVDQMQQRQRLSAATANDVAPSPERRQHGPIERLERAIGDADGRPSRPYRAVDTLAVMQLRGSISAAMRQAGEDFRNRFALAQLDPLRALDLSHLRLGEQSRKAPDAPALRVETARRAVWHAIGAVGGIASPAGSCLWHVVGWERPLKEWALHQGWSGHRVSQEAASGILVAALGALEAHFGNGRI